MAASPVLPALLEVAAVALVVAAAEAQLPLARAIGDAPPESFDAIELALGALLTAQ